MDRDEHTAANVRTLWTAVFGEPPAVDADPAFLIAHLVSALPTPGYSTLRRYGRLSVDASAPS
jgi:hypothetical protein